MTTIHTIAAAFILATAFAAPAAAADREWDFFMYPYKGGAPDPVVTATTKPDQGWHAFIYRYKGGAVDPVITGSAKPVECWDAFMYPYKQAAF